MIGPIRKKLFSFLTEVKPDERDRVGVFHPKETVPACEEPKFIVWPWS